MSDFYVVWNPNGRNPQFRHDLREEAVNEAERLACIEPGQEFFVLHAVSVSRKPKPVETISLDGYDPELPF